MVFLDRQSLVKTDKRETGNGGERKQIGHEVELKMPDIIYYVLLIISNYQ